MSAAAILPTDAVMDFGTPIAWTPVGLQPGKALQVPTYAPTAPAVPKTQLEKTLVEPTPAPTASASVTSLATYIMWALVALVALLLLRRVMANT